MYALLSVNDIRSIHKIAFPYFLSFSDLDLLYEVIIISRRKL